MIQVRYLNMIKNVSWTETVEESQFVELCVFSPDIITGLSVFKLHSLLPLITKNRKRKIFFLEHCKIMKGPC